MARRFSARLVADDGTGDTVASRTDMGTGPYGSGPRVRSSVPAEPPIIAAKYLLERPLGEGGMGTIWQAYNVHLDLPVAVKVLRPELRSDDCGAPPD